MDGSDEVLEDAVLDLSGESAGEKGLDSSSPFFVSKKAAAVLKHEILKQYVVPFASKVGRYAPDGRVVYLDGYAGPGRYEDGTPGSPALILDEAARIGGFRQLDCYFIEKQRKSYSSLAKLVEEAQQKGISAHALRGKVEKHLGQVLERAQGAPLFAFLDPFGLGVSYDSLTNQIFGSRGWATGRHATEILLNFNANAVRRIGGYLNSSKDIPGKEATLEAMDAACGGSWWRDEFRASADNVEAVRRITNEFSKRVGQAVGASSWRIAVRNRAHHQVAYYLLYFTRHRDGAWLFGDAVSLAQVEWRRACLPPPEEDALFSAVDTFDEEEKQREQEWVATIRRNIQGLQQKLGAFTVDAHLPQIMSGVLGEARQKHIRAAVKELYKEGKTGCNGVGDLRKLRITAV
ncbi:three-Cys-motif partner protein TcmP [Streptomyces antibioticus]|uniref:three-Cys-motif partner protein TcmP n=1 Tax=Streptomyces antibioticus TaxID=1890 RepID=UPI0036C0FB6A